MGGSFRFMAYFAQVMASLCACAYKGAQVYSFRRFLKIQNPSAKLYMCFIWNSQLSLNSYPSLKLQHPHNTCALLLSCYFSLSFAPKNTETLHTEIRVIHGILWWQQADWWAQWNCSHALHSVAHMLTANISVFFWTQSKVGPICVKYITALLLLQSQQDSAKHVVNRLFYLLRCTTWEILYHLSPSFKNSILKTNNCNQLVFFLVCFDWNTTKEKS